MQVLLLLGVILTQVGCGSGAVEGARQPDSGLVGTSWLAEDIDGRGVLDRVQSTLTFESAQRVAGRAACNRYFGSLELLNEGLRIRVGGTTRMACAPAVLDQEYRFLAALAAVTTYRRDGDRLFLLDDAGATRLRLSPLDASSEPRAGAAGSVRAYGGRRSVVEDARRRGVEFRAVGNEPGWVLELSSQMIVFVGNYGSARIATPRPAPAMDEGARETIYAAVTEAHRLTLRIREVECVDSMSGEQWEATVEVEVDGKTYRGCGATLR